VPNTKTILRFVVIEGDVLHPQSGKRMAYPDPPNARANANYAALRASSLGAAAS
jgi:hypothetical protein